MWGVCFCSFNGRHRVWEATAESIETSEPRPSDQRIKLSVFIKWIRIRICYKFVCFFFLLLSTGLCLSEEARGKATIFAPTRHWLAYTASIFYQTHFITKMCDWYLVLKKLSKDFSIISVWNVEIFSSCKNRLEALKSFVFILCFWIIYEIHFRQLKNNCILHMHVYLQGLEKTPRILGY